MIELLDGRSKLYQWDTDRYIVVSNACTQVHFKVSLAQPAIPVDVEERDGNYVALIPPELLQDTKDVVVYAFTGSPECGYTQEERVFDVIPKPKPADYVFTPTEQMTLKEIKEIAQSVREDADAGKFDGKDGEKGESGPKGDPGDKGDDGFSPIVTFIEDEEGTKMQVEDAEGTKSISITTGTDGEDGISPEIDVVETESGYNITITDAEGTESIEIHHGTKGDKGDKGDPGIDGKDGTPGADGQDGAKGDPFTYDDFTEEQLALLKGEKGDTGDRGEQGNPGYTPQKGIDYFTPEDIESLNIPYNEVKSLQYYGEANIAPSDASLFIASTINEDDKTVYLKQNPDVTVAGDIIVPYEFSVNDEMYLVTGVDSLAFYQNKNITSLMLPGSVTQIGTSTVSKCTLLERIVLPNSVTTIYANSLSTDHLKDIYYRGTKAQFDAMTKSLAMSSWKKNDTIHYEYSEPTTIDTELSDTSENAVQNKAVTEELNAVMAMATSASADAMNAFNEVQALANRVSKVETDIGDIDTALAEIIALQSSYIGGDSV